MNPLRRPSALAIDWLMCASMNFVQSRHRLPAGGRAALERYIAKCEPLTVQDFYAIAEHAAIPSEVPEAYGATMSWTSPVRSGFPENDRAQVELFPSAQGWSAPTVLMLHALMSASPRGYRRWAAAFQRARLERMPRSFALPLLASPARHVQWPTGDHRGPCAHRRRIAAGRDRIASITRGFAEAGRARVWRAWVELRRMDRRIAGDGRSGPAFRRLNGADRARGARHLGMPGERIHPTGIAARGDRARAGLAPFSPELALAQHAGLSAGAGAFGRGRVPS